MAVMGLDLLVHRTGGVTATERAIDAARADSALAALVRAVEEGLTAALVLCARWLDLPAEAAGRVTLDPDTGLDAREAELNEQVLEHAQDHAKVAAIGAELSALAAEKDELEGEWLEATELLE